MKKEYIEPEVKVLLMLGQPFMNEGFSVNDDDPVKPGDEEEIEANSTSIWEEEGSEW